MKRSVLNSRPFAGSWPAKRTFTTLLVGLLVSSMFSFNTPGPEKAPAPKGKVPGELAGGWQKGNFPMTDFFTYDDSDTRSLDSTFAIKLSDDAQAELFLYLPGFDGNCRSHTLAHLKGTVQVNGNLLTITGQSGTYRGLYSEVCGSAGSNFERPMTAAEVNKYVFTLYWSREQRDGKDYLVTRSVANTGATDLFSPVNW